MRAHRLVVFLLPLLMAAQNLEEFEKKVTEFTLSNGLHFIVVERHEAPVVSFHTYVNAGSVDDPSGATGIAHMFEHMAFKGTESIGSKNWPEEKKAIDQVEAVYDRLDAEQNKGIKADPQKVATLKADLKTAEEKANSLVVPNLYPRIIEQNGGENMNAETSWDSTRVFLQPAVESTRAMVPAGVAAVHPARLPRVLQGARRGHGGVPHAGGIGAAGQAVANISGDGF